MAERTEDVYCSRRLRGIQNHFKHEGQFIPPNPPLGAMQCTLARVSEGRAQDMIGIYMEESWDKQYEAHSENYGCHTWYVTASVRVTALSLDDPSNGVRDSTDWGVRKTCPPQPGGLPP